MNIRTSARALVPPFLILISTLLPAGAVNIAPEGTGIIGVNDSSDFTDLGTPLAHVGVVASINDGNLTTRVDTFGNGSLGYSYVGVEWASPRADAVKTLVLTMATFFDGGWFGPNGSNPGAGGALTAAHLTAPSVQVSTDFGVTWITVPSTSTYITAFTGHRVGGGAVVNPSSRAATFTLDVAEPNITGVRLIGPNGGPADGNGFIGVFELEITALPANDLDADGMADDWESAHSLNPGLNDASGDPDSDGLSNVQEYNANTDPQDSDSDDDGLNDGPEILTVLSNPHLPDTDGDGLTDGAEVAIHHTSPINPDTDGDGLTDAFEVTTVHSNPTAVDTDGDGFKDASELRFGRNPLLAASHPSDIALLGTGIIGTNNAVDADAGAAHANAGVVGFINDGDAGTRVDSFGVGGDPMSFVGILWPTARTTAVDRLQFDMAVFFDGGWFGPNGSNPGAGGVLAAGDLMEPSVQVTSNGGVTWTTVAATSDYLIVADGLPLPAVAFGAPTSVTANFTLTTPQAGINGIRLIGTNGGVADGNGFLGVFELLVRDVSSANDLDDDGLTASDETAIYHTDPDDHDSDHDGLIDGDEVRVYLTNPLVADSDGDEFNDYLEITQGTNPLNTASFPSNIGLIGLAVLGTNDAIDGDEGTTVAHGGGVASVNDGSPVTRVDTFDLVAGDTFSYVGIVWPTAIHYPINSMTLTMATFYDGGWFGPNGIGPGPAASLEAALHLTVPAVQITYDHGLTWVDAIAPSNYLAAVDGHRLPAVAGGTPTAAMATFVFDPPLPTSETAVHGVRLIGPEGGTASGGFLGVYELAIYTGSSPVDIDGDGQSDADELLAGTDSTNPAESLKIASAERIGNQVLLKWTSVPGKIYTVESSDTLVFWSPLKSGIAAGAGSTTQATITLPAPPPAQLHLRIAVQTL